MKKILSVLASCLLTLQLFAQAPQRLSYQAIVRNANNVLVTNAPIRMRISILQGSITGTAVYTELHSTTTNASGVAFIEVGGGTSPVGSFAAINWGQGPYFLRSETDPNNGTNYTIVGTTQLLSVPYALQSNRSDSAARAGNGLPPTSSYGALQLFNCNGVVQYTPCLPRITTATIDSIGMNTAVSGGNISEDGGAPVTARGVVWTTAQNPTVAFKTSNGTGSGAFKSNLSGLAENTSYLVRAYATNSAGTAYGNQISFTTLPPLASLAGLNCAGATNSGSLAAEITASGVTSIIPYTGGNGGTYIAQSFPSSGVTGLTANLAAGTLASGAGTLTLNISGTPSASGTASFALSIGGQSCVLTRAVNFGLSGNTSHNCGAANVHNPTIAYGSMTDQDGNVYKTVQIGNQTWMAENLKTTKFRNGAAISNITDSAQWHNNTTGAYCSYNNNVLNDCPYGKLYNWHAVNSTNQLCPTGWHVPTDIEWTALTNFFPTAELGAGSRMKSAGTQYWLNGNIGATNNSGFSGLPGGNRDAEQSFAGIGLWGIWWTSTQNGSTTALVRFLSANELSASALSAFKSSGYSVRCMKDIDYPPAAIASLSCIHSESGLLISGTAASGVKSTFSYTGGNGGIYAAQTISSTGVTGLTATLAAGILANGSGSLSFNITGTPATTGTASFVVNIGGQSCVLTRTVSASSAVVASLNCAQATNNGTLTAGRAASPTVTSIIPYTGGNGVQYAAQTIPSTGITGLTANLAAGRLANGSGNLTVTITGTPPMGMSGNASFALNIGGQSCTLIRTVTLPAASITALQCSNSFYQGSGFLVSGVPTSGISIGIPYSGGNGGTYGTQSISSTGVTGLTATRTAGTLEVVTGARVADIFYTISGTPSIDGIANFLLSLGGQSCTVSLTVHLPPAAVTSLNCGAATHSGTLTAGTPATGASSIIAYTGGNGGTYAAQTINSTGVTGLTATLTGGLLARGAGTLNLNISGTPTPGMSGNATFTLNFGGQTCTFTRTVSLPAASITTLNCTGATNTGTLTVGNVASGVSISIPYTGGNGGTYAAQTIASTGVTGLIATLAAGTVQSGAGTLTYTITGTPATNGTASFALSIGGQTCTFTQTVNLPAASITTLNCTGAANTGTLTAGTAASGVSISIPYTGGNGGTYAAQTIASTGVTGLTATLPAGTLALGNGTLTVTISGTPTLGMSGNSSFALNIGGQPCTLIRTVIPPAAAVTSLNCGQGTHSGTLTAGTAATGVTSIVAYTGGNGGTYAAQTIASIGVTGLTATLPAGTLALGNGTLTVTISGTPTFGMSGNASFALNIGGQPCTLIRTVTPPAAAVTSLNCGQATHSGTLTAGTAATGVSSIIAYTGGNGGIYAAQSIPSTGVTGLTATLTADTLTLGDGTLTITIAGTPTLGMSGDAIFALNIGGQPCTLTRTVSLPPAAITSLNCGSVTNNGTLTAGVPANGVSISIPYSGANGGTFVTQSIRSTGVTGLTATRAAGTLPVGNGIITYNITGTPAAGTSGNATFVLSIGGQTCTLTRTVNLPAAAITALSCSTATNNGNLIRGVAASGVNSVVSYTGGNGGAYAAQTIASTGVTGLTATLAAGTLLSVAGTLTYSITGTPATNGTASFALSIGGQTCTLTRTVNLPAAAITTLNCTGATNTGTLTAGTAASGVSISIPYTGGNGGTYAAQTIASTGVTGLTATLAAGTLLSGAGTLTYSITGTPVTGGTASFALSIGGQTCTLSRSVDLPPVAGITAHSCGAANVHNITIPYGSTTDQEGNVYRTVTIGSQTWMAENLRTTIYRNGNPIVNITDQTEWLNTQSGAYCSYENNITNDCPYGKLYNWYAVSNTNQLCPSGWRVPTAADWRILINAVGGELVAGGNLKSTQYFNSPNQDANNSSGFSALPAGYRATIGGFGLLNFQSYWWSATGSGSLATFFNVGYYTGSSSENVQGGMGDGMSVRCLRN